MAEEEEEEVSLGAFKIERWDADEDMLEQIQTRSGLCRTHGILVVGKPASGKATLAGTLAAKLGAVHIGFPQILEEALESHLLHNQMQELRKVIDDFAKRKQASGGDEGDGQGEGEGKGEGERGGEDEGDGVNVGADSPDPPMSEEEYEGKKTELEELERLWQTKRWCEEYGLAADLLLSGKKVDVDTLVPLLKARLRFADVGLRGYVFDTLLPGVELEIFESPEVPRLDFILHTVMSDEAALARIAGLNLHLPSGLLYSASDLTPGEHQALVPAEGGEGEDPPVDEDGQRLMVRWSPPPELLMSLVRREEDEVKRAQERLAQYYERISSKEFGRIVQETLPSRVMGLDANQSPGKLLRCALLALNLDRCPIVHPPLPLPLDEGEEPSLAWALSKGVAEIAGKRSLSLWGHFCPVALVEDRKMLLGDARFATEFLGRIFLLSSWSAQQKFVADPATYVSSPPTPPRMRVMVMGAPVTGKTAVANWIANKYSATRLDCLKLLERAVAGGGGEELEGQAVDCLLKGEQIPGELMMKLLGKELGIELQKVTVSEEEEAGATVKLPALTSDGPGGEWGQAPPDQADLRFVLDGPPLSPDFVHALAAHQLLPTCVILLEDSEEPVGRARTDAAKAEDLYWDLGKEATLERTTGTQFPFAGAGSQQRERMEEVKGLLEAAGCLVLKLPATLGLLELQEAAAARVDPFVYGVAVSEEVRGAEQVEWVQEPQSEDGEEERPGLQVLGYLGKFCPVTWRRGGELVPGKGSFAAAWRGKVYLCRGQEELDSFLFNPSYFAPVPSAAPEFILGNRQPPLPPARVMLLGALGSGRKERAEELAQHFGLHVLNLQSLLPPKPPPPKEGEEGSEESSEEREWTEDEVEELVKGMKAALSSPPLSELGVLLEGEPLAEPLLEALVRHKLHPHLAVVMSMQEEEAVRRLYGSKEILRFPRPHRLPFYPFLDPHRQRRELRALRHLGIEAPNANPRDEEGKPKPKPSREELLAAAEEAETAVKRRIEEENSKASSLLEAMAARLGEEGVTVRKLRVSAAEEKQERWLQQTVGKLLAHPQSLLAAPLPVSRDKAVALLDARVRRLSKFGMVCPVRLMEEEGVISPSSISDMSFAVVYGPHLYLCKDALARRCFLADPVRFVLQPPPPPPAFQRIVVLGPPKSGRSSLAEAIAADLGLVLLSPARIVRELLEDASSLAQRIREELRKGLEVSEELLGQAVCAAAHRYPGWVLDGFPCSKEQAERMEEADVGVTSVIVLKLEDAACRERARKELQRIGADGFFERPRRRIVLAGDGEEEPQERLEETPPLLTGEEAIKQGLAILSLEQESSEMQAIRRTLTRDKDVEEVVDARRNRAGVHRQVLRELRMAASGRQQYLMRRELKHPAPLAEQRRWIRREDLRERRGDFCVKSEEGKVVGDYCPVAWKLEEELLLCPPDSRLSNMLEVAGRFYCASSKHMLELMANPSYYLHSHPLPPHVPRRLEEEEGRRVGEESIEYKGYCPVTLLDGPGEDPVTGKKLPVQAALLKPAYDAPPAARLYLVKYQDKIYRMMSEEKLDRFMRKPWKYVDLKLPVKLPFDKRPVDLASLPLPGYLEQALVEELTAALLLVGQTRPKFPGLTPEQSALKLLALVLRSRNRRNSSVDARLHGLNLDLYVEACSLLVRDAKAGELPTPVLADSETVEKYLSTRARGANDCIKY